MSSAIDIAKAYLAFSLSDLRSFGLIERSICREESGHLKEAIQSHKEIERKCDETFMALYRGDFLFADQKHSLNKDNEEELKSKDYVIWMIISILLSVILITSRVYRLYIHIKKTRKETQEECERLRSEKEGIELQLAQLKNERDGLTQVLQEQSELPESVRDILLLRLNLVNCLLAKEITDNEAYAKPLKTWLSSTLKDKQSFMNMMRNAYTASHPFFIAHLIECGLTDDEINISCLYALGLRGKEISQYLETRSLYNMSSAIRKKLHLKEDNTNLGPYIKSLVDSANPAQKKKDCNKKDQGAMAMF